MTLLRYFAEDGNFTLIIKDFNDDGGPSLSLIIWPRYDSESLNFFFFNELIRSRLRNSNHTK